MTRHYRHSPTIPKLLKQIRMEQGLSKATIAERLGIDPTAHRQLTNWEEGTSDPRLSSIERWADALGYELDLHPKG